MYTTNNFFEYIAWFKSCTKEIYLEIVNSFTPLVNEHSTAIFIVLLGLYSLLALILLMDTKEGLDPEGLGGEYIVKNEDKIIHKGKVVYKDESNRKPIVDAVYSSVPVGTPFYDGQLNVTKYPLNKPQKVPGFFIYQLNDPLGLGLATIRGKSYKSESRISINGVVRVGYFYTASSTGEQENSLRMSILKEYSDQWSEYRVCSAMWPANIYSRGNGYAMDVLESPLKVDEK